MAESVAKLNKLSEAIRFVKLPYGIFDADMSGTGRKKLTGSAERLYGLIDGLSSSAKSRDKSASLSYDDIHAITNESRATTARSIERLVDFGLMEQDKSDRMRTKYRILKRKAFRGYIALDKELFALIKEIYGISQFNLREKFVLSFMVGLATRKGAEGIYIGSYGTIGKVINVDESTAKKIVISLMKKKLFHRPKDCKGDSKSNPSRYILDTALRLAWEKVLLRREEEKARKDEARRAEYAEEKAAEREELKRRQEAEQEEREARRRYYFGIRKIEEQRVEKLKATLFADEDYHDVYSKFKKIEIAIARAEVYSPELLDELEKEQKVLKDKRTWIMNLYGISEADLQTHYRCDECRDTGFKNGLPCHCYPGKER